MSENRKPFHEAIAQKLIEQLQAGTAPWQKPWVAGEVHLGLPVNPSTGKRYRGINALNLMSEGRTDPRWMTYRQAAAMNAQVRKGERGTTVQYWKFSEEQLARNELGQQVLDAEGKPVRVTVMLERPRVFLATVFNAEQIEGLPARIEPAPRWDAVERAELILKASGARIVHGETNRAFYRPTTDSIHLPDRGQFPSAEGYYATALHELGHWTGHASRLNRALDHPYGSEGYAKEELRAEIASMMLGNELGIGHDPGQHAAYVGSWIKALQDDPLEIFRAAADAEKIQDHVLAFERKHQQEQNEETDMIRSAAATRANGIEQTISDLEKESDTISATPGTAPPDATQPSRIYLAVPFKEKDEAKHQGARWDRQQQAWYVPPGIDPTPFARWQRTGSQDAEGQAIDGPDLDQTPAPERLHLAVPYGERSAAKAAGALWDPAVKSWYAGPKADMSRLQRWLPERLALEQAPAMSPREEFAEALRTIGAQVEGEHPIMDGHTHRIEVEGDHKGEKAGFYVVHIDGHPAGYIKNNRTGVELTWRAKGYSLDDQQKAALEAEAAQKHAARAEALEHLHTASAQRVSRQLTELVPLIDPTPYLLNKGIAVHAGAFTDQEGQTTCLPALDAEGRLWTMQYIQPDGTKRFAKDSRKEGCFHVVGGLDTLPQAPALVISEGYATAATNAEALGFATVAAFDAGNLTAVALALHAKFPDKPVLILGDDDRQLELTQGVNPGRTKAREAARAVGGTAIFPIFAPGENAYPAELPAITPQTYRTHLQALKALEDAQQDTSGASLTERQRAALQETLLSDAQLAALERMKTHTDFNDLATRSMLGRDGLERQVMAEVQRVIGMAAGPQATVKVQEVRQVPATTARRGVRIA